MLKMYLMCHKSQPKFEINYIVLFLKLLLCHRDTNKQTCDDFYLLVFPASSTWSQPETQGRHPPARHGHVIIAVGSKIYIHGGMAGDKFHNDMYSLDTSKLKLVGSMLIK